MKITAKTAIRKIRAGTAFVVGTMTDDKPWPESYWIVNDAATMETHHVRFDDAPGLDRVKSDAVTSSAIAEAKSK